MEKGTKSLVIALIITFTAGFLALLFSFASKGDIFPSKKIGYVQISGTITSSSKTVAWIDTLINSENVPAILVRISSPGGGVVPSYEIYRKLMEAKEKGKIVVVSMGSMAASGGYMIACAGDVIVANPGSITGSIGVILEAPDVSELMQKLGIRMNTIKSSRYKDIASPYRPMKPEEKDLLKNVIMDVYEQFVQIVADSRGLPADSVRKIADGRIFTGRQAYEIGLVDTLGTLDDAIRIAADLAGIENTPKLKRQKPKRLSIWDLITGQFPEFTMPFSLMYKLTMPSKSVLD